MSYRTLSGLRKPDATTDPEPYALMLLSALQTRPVYTGTVPAHVIERRRRRNRAARTARQTQRRTRG